MAKNGIKGTHCAALLQTAFSWSFKTTHLLCNFNDHKMEVTKDVLYSKSYINFTVW